MTKPINLLKRIVKLIRENNIRTDHISQLEYQNFEENFEQLDNYLNTDFPNIDEIYLSLDLTYSGIVRNGNKHRGYTLLKATIEKGVLRLRMETGMKKYVADEVTTIYQYLKQDNSEFFLEGQENINLDKHKKIEVFLDVKQSQGIDYNDFYEATIMFDGLDYLYYIDKALINQIETMLNLYLENGKGKNFDFLNVENFLKALNDLPIVPKKHQTVQLIYDDGIYITFTLDEEEFSIEEWIYDGDYSSDGFHIQQKVNEISMEDYNGLDSWANIQTAMCKSPELIRYGEDTIFEQTYFDNNWKINGTDDFLNIKEGEADYYNNAGYKGLMKFQNIEASIDGQVRAIGQQYRFDFTFVGVRNFQPVSGAGWLMFDGQNKLNGRIKVHNEKPVNVTLSNN